MGIGQKIKQARLEAGLSQRQLCGDTITRNMLSLIESGRARPGMDTLSALAGRLGRPISYFLEEQAVLLPNRQVIDRARQAFADGAWEQALAALEEYAPPDPVFDPERYLLEALCTLEMASAAISEGRDAYARELLDRAARAGERTPYYTSGLERRLLLLAFRVAPTSAEEIVSRLPGWEDEVLARGYAAFLQAEYARCAAILEGADRRDGQWYLLRGQAALESGDPAAAAEFLCRAEETLPARTMPLLERCYRELGDYKMAYEYACKQRKDP